MINAPKAPAAIRDKIATLDIRYSPSLCAQDSNPSFRPHVFFDRIHFADTAIHGHARERVGIKPRQAEIATSVPLEQPMRRIAQCKAG
jgi:hypothetical protein